MKFRTLATGLIALASASAMQAQTIYSNPDNKSYFGLRLSYELACPGDVNVGHGVKVDLFQNGSGVSFGGIYHMPVFHNFYFEPGLTIAYNTYGVDVTFTDESGFPFEPDDASVRMWQMRLPIIGGYRFDVLDDISFSVFTGPELTMGLSAKEHFKVGNHTLEAGIYSGEDKTLNRPDIKWRFGVGMIYKKHFEVSMSGAVGMCDQYDGPSKMHSNLFDITLGYNF